MGIKKILFLSICVIWLCFSLNAIFATSEIPRTIKVGFYQNDGFNDYDIDGNLSGYAFEYLSGLQRYAGWNFAFVENISFQESLEMLERGEIDLVAGVKKTAEREKLFAFPEWSMGSAYIILSVRAEDDRFYYNDYSCLSAMKIGVIKGSSRNREFERDCCEQGIEKLEYVEYDTYRELRSALHQTKEIDAVLSTTFRSLADEKIILHYSVDEYYLVVNKENQELLKELDEAQHLLNVYNGNFIDLLEQKYKTKGNFNTLVLTREEEQFIKNNPVIRVAAMDFWYPIFYADNGEPSGILADIYCSLERILGIEFDLHICETITEAQQLLNSGDCSVYLGTFGSDAWALEKGMVLTSRITTSNLSYVTSSASLDMYTSSYTCAVERNSYVADIAASYTENLLLCDTVTDCIEAVYSGQVDVAIVESICTIHLSQIPQYRRLLFRTLQEDSLDLRIGVAFGNNEILYSILNKGILSLSKTFVDQCIYKYQMLPPAYSVSDLLFLYPSESLCIIITGIVIIFILVFLVLISYFRKRRAMLLEEKNRELVEATDRAQKASAAKTEFLARMSHDIRTPLNIVLGMEQIAMSNANDACVVTECLEKSQKSAKYLLSLLNDILDKSKLDRHDVVLHYGTFFLYDSLKELCDGYKQLAVESNVQFSYDIEPLAGCRCYADEQRILRVVGNVLMNALKFSDAHGTVLFTATKRMSEESGSADVEFLIHESSAAMGPDVIAQLFDPFPQVDIGRQTGADGLTHIGIGLSISKQLLELMHGTINVSAEPGRGCVFVIQMPLEIIDLCSLDTLNEEKIEELPLDYSGCRALLVEDNELNQEIFREILAGFGISCETADNGRIGVEKFQNSSEGYFNIIFMDIRMPEMDGYKATKIIRSLNRADAKKVPVIAVSANSFDDDREKSVAAGINRHLAKPLQIQELSDTLRDYLGNS